MDNGNKLQACLPEACGPRTRTADDTLTHRNNWVIVSAHRDTSEIHNVVNDAGADTSSIIVEETG